MADLPPLQVVSKSAAVECDELCSGGDRAFYATLQEITTGKKIAIKTGKELYKSLPTAPFPVMRGGVVMAPEGVKQPTELEFLQALYANECTACNMKAQIGKNSELRLGPRFWIGASLMGFAVLYSALKR